ncbi:hypothetical protein [Streptomyces sp. NBC_00091]|uniref:hypothetical protein n=1 Tax=Streptomyces sp. NBC_00091 TaxID=2975648 RepID=UPI00224CCAC7|nr:hypothetical protein [Streptomyces sp. NBC_00091]MCX5381143.1 hypothetical protein [Streptomyces sp. NBC_00091]
MTSPTPRGVLSLDVPDSPGVGLAALLEPSADLLDRARVGWEHFLLSASSEVADE